MDKEFKIACVLCLLILPFIGPWPVKPKISIREQFVCVKCGVETHVYDPVKKVSYCPDHCPGHKWKEIIIGKAVTVCEICGEYKEDG